MLHRLLVFTLPLAFAAVLTGCPGEPTTPDPTGDIRASAKSNVRFKRNERLRNDYAVAMELGLGEICNEFGLYSCTDLVHLVPLGGLSPYNLGITRPPTRTGSTTPIVVDRVALSACVQRVDQDLASPSAALIFDLSGNTIADVEGPGLEAVINQLYKRAVHREARSNEIEILKDLYVDIEAISDGNPVRDWAVASCFAVFTSMEALFY